MKISEVDMDVSEYTGPLRIKETRQPKLCDVCNKNRAMWKHPKKDGGGFAYLCFYCGDH